MEQIHNSLVLAYLGDTIYEYHIRRYLIDQGIVKVKQLQELAINYVSAKNQARFYQELKSQFLTEEEQEIGTRARNHNTNHHPKNCDIITYKHATALEAIIGYLKICGREDRILEIMEYIVKEHPVAIC